MITIIDYGLGNIAAFLNVYKRLNIPVRAVSTEAALAKAERIILPGVGAFDQALDLLQASGMRPVLEELVIGKRVPLLGVCVGMQMLMDGSDEGDREGLGWIAGRTRAFAGRPELSDLPLPHMGWNDIIPSQRKALFAIQEESLRYYFLHSYYVEPSDPVNCAAIANYGFDFACAVHRDNIWGVQFHPEKSHQFGAALLHNFASL